METQELQKDPKCKDLINNSFKNRFRDIKFLYDAYCNGEEDTEEGNIHEYALSFDYIPAHTFTDQKRGFFCYLISTGGPQEEFNFYVDETFEPYRIEFRYKDWFDGACKVLTGKKFEYMADFFTEYLGCGDKFYLNELVKKALE